MNIEQIKVSELRPFEAYPFKVQHDEQLEELSHELYSCAENIASIDERMNGIHIQMEKTLAQQEAENKKKWALLPGLS